MSRSHIGDEIFIGEQKFEIIEKIFHINYY